MNRDKASGYVLLAWFIAVGLISFRAVSTNQSQAFPKNMPQPSIYLGSAVLFTMLWGLTFLTPSLAVMLAFGTDFGIFAQPYLAGSKVGIADQVSTWLNTVSPATKKSG